MKIWKYPMVKRDGIITMPLGAQILSCQMQGDLPCLWALVDENETGKDARYFTAIGTGDEIGYPVNCLQFIATVQTDNGFVYHIFEVVR